MNKKIINLNLIKNIEISRSFSKKIQVRAFEPIELFSSYKAIMKEGSTEQEIDEMSDELYKKAKEDVLTELINKEF